MNKVIYKKEFFSLAIGMCTLAASLNAQTQVNQNEITRILGKQEQIASQQQQSSSKYELNGWFNHLDLGASVGSTGIGIELATPLSKYAKLRAGFCYMPTFHYNMSFSIDTYDESGKLLQKFDEIASAMKEVTGYTMDQQVDMIGEPTFYNFNVLVDVTPFRNKNWHITTGLYFGPSRIAKAYNTTEEMPTLIGFMMYNRAYDFTTTGEYFDKPIYGSNYLDPMLGQELGNRFESYGRLAVHIGDFKNDGTPYRMVPNDECMTKANIYVNRVRPYLGFGYTGPVNDKGRFTYSIDCGAMFWGGTPSIVTHDGTDIAKDVENIDGKVGRYVDVIKFFKVYPVITVKISGRMF